MLFTVIYKNSHKLMLCFTSFRLVFQKQSRRKKRVSSYGFWSRLSKIRTNFYFVRFFPTLPSTKNETNRKKLVRFVFFCNVTTRPKDKKNRRLSIKPNYNEEIIMKVSNGQSAVHGYDGNDSIIEVDIVFITNHKNTENVRNSEYSVASDSFVSVIYK